MEDRYGNRSLARWLKAKRKSRKEKQRTRELMLEDSSELLKAMPASLLAYPATPDECLPMTPPTVNYAAEDRFDFVHCSPADEIRAHGFGVALNL